MMWAITIVQNESCEPELAEDQQRRDPGDDLRRRRAGPASGRSRPAPSALASGPARSRACVPSTVAPSIVRAAISSARTATRAAIVVEELARTSAARSRRRRQRLDAVEREQDHDHDRQEQEQVERDRLQTRRKRGLSQAPRVAIRWLHLARHAPPSAGRRPSRPRGRASSPRSAPRRTASCWRRRTGAGSGCRSCRCRGRRAAARRRSRRPRAGRQSTRRRGSPASSAAG